MSITYEKVCERGHKFIEITGYEGTVTRLVVPGEIDGLPVERIRGHAFEGREDLREVYLPDSLRCLKTFVFHKCSSLTKVSMHDSVSDYHDGVIRHCASLEEIEIFFSGSSYELVKDLLADNDRALHFQMHLPGGELQMMFPDYVVVASENTMARTIQFAFEGVGYAYRECVRKKEIRWREYDSLFEAMTHFGTTISVRIAVDRLMYPVDLDERAKERYETFLRDHASEAISFMIRRKMEAHIDFLLESELLTEEAADQGLKIASESGETEICARIMEYQRARHGEVVTEEGSDGMLSLDDW